VHVTAAAGSFLHTQGQDMPWAQVLMLDVLALYAAAAALACAVLVLCFRRLLRACHSGRHLARSEHGSRRKQD
jgi:NADH:ubiquinone oxidoreductase subunit K